jgi:phage-related protein
MPFPTFTPAVPPSPGTETDREIKLKTAEFGDGYSQETRDGINHIRQVVTLNWEVLTIEQAAAIEDFFHARGGDEPFYYALSDDVTRKWTCKTFKRRREGPNSVSATFKQSFLPDPDPPA